MNSLLYYSRIRFYFIGNLVLSFLLIACIENKKENDPITIQWNGEKAEGIDIPRKLLKGVNEDSITKHLQVRLFSNSNDILGEYTINKGSVSFKPLVAFTSGLKYEVLYSDKLISQFEIPPLKVKEKTEIVSIYPTTDTLPENALKLYLVFSNPMQEGQSLNNITVIRNDNDTLHSTFLDLDHELWNKERTTLTLWFDPGRIKRDLQPNKSLGLPLQKNNSYKIIISKEWRDARGVALKSNFHKNFVVGKRDIASPDPDNWTVSKTKVSSKEPLLVFLHEPLDYLLLKNAVRITDDEGNILSGSVEPMEKETVLRFTPAEAWKQGTYTIEIESRLEDLAGNNLNRLFDKDLTQTANKEQKSIFTKKFRVD